MLESFGRRVSTSIAIARKVFTSDTASAPASSEARANEATSVTLGVNFGMTGRCVTFFTALTTSKVPCRLHPNVIGADLDPDGVAAIYGDRYERLRSLKRRWDPDNVFRGSHNIPPAEAHDIAQLRAGG